MKLVLSFRRFAQMACLTFYLLGGGWVVNNVPAHTVGIKTEENEKIKGITASTPPHFMSEAEKKPPLDFVP